MPKTVSRFLITNPRSDAATLQDPSPSHFSGATSLPPLGLGHSPRVLSSLESITALPCDDVLSL